MCDRGCLVDIKRTKEDVDEIKINVQKLLDMEHNRTIYLVNLHNRVETIENKCKAKDSEQIETKKKIWDLKAGIIIGVVVTLVGTLLTYLSIVLI